MKLKSKLILAAVPLLLLLLGSGVLGLRYWWYHAYSRGSRTGVIRKLSVKGSPLCRYYAGELVLGGGAFGASPQIFEFTLDDYQDSNPLVGQLHAAEKSGKQVTLDYRQDLDNKGKLWPCAPTDYYITRVE